MSHLLPRGLAHAEENIGAFVKSAHGEMLISRERGEVSLIPVEILTESIFIGHGAGWLGFDSLGSEGLVPMACW